MIATIGFHWGKTRIFLHICLGIFLLFNFQAFSQGVNGNDCRRLKKGCFIFEAKEGEIHLIKRSRKQQVEIELHSQSKAKTSLRWLGDCVYELTLQKEKNDTTKNINIPVIIRIVEIQGNTYTFNSASFDDLIMLEGKMRKIGRREYRRRLRQGL